MYFSPNSTYECDDLQVLRAQNVKQDLKTSQNI